MTGFPVSVSLNLSLNIPVEFCSGVSLLATQTIVLGFRFLYHTQKYMFCEFSMLVNPASNFPVSETR